MGLRIKTPDQVNDQYVGWSSYDQDLERWTYVGPRTVADRFLPYLPTGGCTLADVGCGTGLSFQYYPGSSITGFDFCEAQLRRAERKVDTVVAVGTSVTLQLADVVNLPADTSAFDAAISVSVSEHVEDLRQMVSEMSRIVQRDGYFAITAPETQLDGCICRDPEDVAEVISSLGLQIVEQFAYISHFQYADPDQPATYHCFIVRNTKGQQTLLGMCRWLLLSLVAFVLAHWGYPSMATAALPDWAVAAAVVLESGVGRCFSDAVVS